ncbi:transcriptional regulator, TetR family [Desulfocucumis palustris]|uniref:Transcriptional regulator, TetR family n=1 Tax=Desulfocucumis palustris TaxID=1898651 RepID=A0A2L2X929_9FIRM|nr:TetR/AcrR family transcriptional regulator [Desulfocucumis palustris]GBF32093.1 transcriptional regulator, TetR family [Desulfocucumis palustris]
MVDKEKPNNRKKQAIETKKKIYESAEQLFGKYGFDNVSVDSIVEIAGVSKGAFYVHFNSKDSLIAELIADYVDKLDFDYKSYFESFPDSTTASDILISLAGKIADIIAFTIGYDHIKIIYKANITKTINTDAALDYNRELYKIFSNIISRGIEQGEFKTDIAVDTITRHCIISLRGITYEWCIRYPEFNLKDYVQEHFEMLLTGIKKQ